MEAEFRDRLEVQFSSLYHAMQSVCSEEEISEVAHFVDHDEYGIALEAAADILLKKPSVPSQCIQIAEGLAVQMKLLSEPIVVQLLGRRKQ